MSVTAKAVNTEVSSAAVNSTTTNPTGAASIAAASAASNDTKTGKDVGSASDVSTSTATAASSKEALTGDLKQRLAVVVEQATNANTNGRFTVGNLFASQKMGENSVTACDEAVRLLEEILKTLDKNSLAYRELTNVQKGAKECDTQAKMALEAIGQVSSAAFVALQEGDVALAELIAVYNSLQAEQLQAKNALAQFTSQLQVKSVVAKKVGEVQAALQKNVTTLESLIQRLNFVVVEATKANSDGRMAVTNLAPAQAFGCYSVVACDQAVDSLDKILKTLDPASKEYKELDAVQKKAIAVQKKSQEAIVVMNQIVIGATSALAVGDASLRDLLAVYNSLKASNESKPNAVMTFSPSAAAAATATVACAAGAGSPNTTPISAVTTSNTCRIA